EMAPSGSSERSLGHQPADRAQPQMLGRQPRVLAGRTKLMWERPLVRIAALHARHPWACVRHPQHFLRDNESSAKIFGLCREYGFLRGKKESTFATCEIGFIVHSREMPIVIEEIVALHRLDHHRIAFAISSGVSGNSCPPSLSKCMLLIAGGSRPVRLR